MTDWNKTRRRFLLSIITIILLGGIVAIFFAIIYVIIQYRLMDYDAMVLIYFIIGLIVSIIVFAFAIIATCTERECLTVFALVLLVVFDIVIIAIAFFGLVAQDRLISWIQGLWTPPISDTTMAIVVGLEDEFHCCGWAELRENCTANSTTPCHDVIPDKFDKYEKLIAGILLALGIILLIGLIYSAVTICRHRDSEGEATLYTDELIPTTKIVPASKTQSPQQGYDW
jgi:hypothetical protein